VHEIPVEYYPDYLPEPLATSLLKALNQELSWSQESLRMYGETIPFPRLMAWYGEPGTAYRFSGKTHHPQEPNAQLRALMELLQTDFGKPFNAVLANAYRSGSDSMSWHSDNEPELGPEPFIASISLGASRTFRMRHKSSKTSQSYSLNHGSLLIMKDHSQKDWEHCIPKTKKPVDLRINLTFRFVFPR
jgi:alkylated DNA repair dioxygenase AlkB